MFFPVRLTKDNLLEEARGLSRRTDKKRVA